MNHHPATTELLAWQKVPAQLLLDVDVHHAAIGALRILIGVVGKGIVCQPVLLKNGDLQRGVKGSYACNEWVGLLVFYYPLLYHLRVFLSTADGSSQILPVRAAGTAPPAFFSSFTPKSIPKPETVATEMRRLKQIEDENSKLRKVVADLSLDKEMLQDVIRRNVWSAPSVQGSWI